MIICDHFRHSEVTQAKQISSQSLWERSKNTLNQLSTSVAVCQVVDERKKYSSTPTVAIGYKWIWLLSFVKALVSIRLKGFSV